MATAKWSIVDDEPWNDYRRNGEIVAGRRITIREATTGREAEFTVPVSQYTPDIVAQEAQERADSILAVSQLGEG